MTTSERRVALLAADGLSNKAIARRLWISLSGVEWHLTQVYRKLGIPSLGRPALRLALIFDHFDIEVVK